MPYQLISLAGALMVLGAYAGLQFGRMARQGLAFSLLNFVGASLLAWVAVVDRRLGFILLETAWALLSVPGVLRALRREVREG
jgi:hypothetical protein